MRLLVTIAHYFKKDSSAEWHGTLGSGRAPVARIAALNAEIVSLHRYFGPHRAAIDDKLRAFDKAERNTIDIVVITVRGCHVLDQIGIDPKTYTINHFDGPPLMLPFEAQRIMRERVGGYDLYAYMEDDHVIVDPDFFRKITWFVECFGPGAMLIPTRYEMAHSGTPAKVEFSPRLSRRATAAFRRPDLLPSLVGCWHGREQTFRLPNNPHTGCFFVTDAQLKHWIAQPSFYDRDSSFVSPLESAATYAPGRVFGMYKPAEPDPWFLAVEHFGAHYAARAAPPGESYGEPPLLALAEAAAGGNAVLPRGIGNESINTVIAQASQLRHELHHLKSSRSALAKALAAAIWKRSFWKRFLRKR
jgi:hypothetical protein